MKNKPPIPICTAFLTCRTLAIDPRTGEDVLVGLPRAFWSRNYPAATPLSLFIRCTSAHGNYPVEVQLQNALGEIVWKDGPPELMEMLDPLEMYDLKMNTNVVFPAPGVYQFVRVLNGDELTRQRFHAILGEVPVRHQRADS
jgi:hypothetical protein